MTRSMLAAEREYHAVDGRETENREVPLSVLPPQVPMLPVLDELFRVGIMTTVNYFYSYIGTEDEELLDRVTRYCGRRDRILSRMRQEISTAGRLLSVSPERFDLCRFSLAALRLDLRRRMTQWDLTAFDPDRRGRVLAVLQGEMDTLPAVDAYFDRLEVLL